MSRASLKALVPFVVILVVAIAAVVFLSNGSERDTGGPAELPAAEDNTGGVSADAPSEDATASVSDPAVVDPTVTVNDPVPDSVVTVLFDLIEAQDFSPVMDETYTVEFVETTDNVRIEGEFGEGPREFEFKFDNGAWKLSGQS